MNINSIFRTSRRGPSSGIGWFLGLLGLCICLIAFLPSPGLTKTKPLRTPHPEPELKIVELALAPLPYSPKNGALEFSVVVQLPKELDGATILEVSSLISSPSKTSLRFLSHRQAVQVPAANGNSDGPPKLTIRLSWDGQDHRKQLAGPGAYAYEVRTKLLTDGEKGPRTLMVSWPKRGTLDVK